MAKFLFLDLIEKFIDQGFKFREFYEKLLQNIFKIIKLWVDRWEDIFSKWPNLNFC